MNNLIDFNECRTFLNDYEGADTKLKIQFNNEIYMLKLGKELEHDDNRFCECYQQRVALAFQGFDA